MKRWWWIGGGSLAAAAILATALLARGREPQLTSTCPDAVSELAAGLDSEMKLYHAEALGHFERALALDPDFVLAKVMLVESLGADQQERREALVGQIAAADLDCLSDREQLLARRVLALSKRDRDAAAVLVDEYLTAHPDDTWVLQIRGERAWQNGDDELAESTYRRLVELNPNWVQAYNMLGYAAMQRGAFAEAEEHLTSYRFIAPDQANPHDSLGELFLLQGRLDEAAESFERALEIKPDFWSSHLQLVRLHMLRHDLPAIHGVVARAEHLADCPVGCRRDLSCLALLAERVERRAWEEVTETAGCEDVVQVGDLVAQARHLAACHLRRWELAEEVESSIAKRAEHGGGSSEPARRAAAFLLHLRGVRHAMQGNLDVAGRFLREADAALRFDGAQRGLLKLGNQLCLAEVLLARGQGDAAREVVAGVRAVNPLLADGFEEGRERLLDLD
jgi:tetratricopeptide (TPR) repeat protein